MMFQVVRRTAFTKVSARTFSSIPARRNIISELYVNELKSFKPIAVSEEDAASATKAWSLPVAPKAPEIEGDITTDIAAYEAADVETESHSGEAGSESFGEDWFVVEDVKPEHH